jgi:hypothetical protein
MNNQPWTKLEDGLFREMVENGVLAEQIAARLERDISDLKRRSYSLGFPRKWFKRPSPALPFLARGSV